MRHLCWTIVAAGTLGAVASASTPAPPPGATARCGDGTYSYSQHHSGTCSHHGGVAAWLTGAAPRQASTTAVGTTVLLAPRTRTTGCRLAADPDRRCSPGAYYTRLTRGVICSGSFHTS